MTNSTKIKLKNNLSCYLMGGLPILGFLFFSLIPMCIAFWMAFNHLESLDFSKAELCGWENFAYVLKDKLFYKAIRNTLISLLSLPISMVLGFLIAYTLNKKELLGKKIYRTLFFIPYICSAVAVTYVFKAMFDTEFGIINSLFGTRVNFLMNPYWFMSVILLIMVWTGTGFYIILYQAALTSINESIIEAAELDGAGPLRKIVSIVFPSISPTTFYLVVMGIIGGLQNFTWFQILCDPLKVAGLGYGPNDVGITVVYYLYSKAFGSMGSAIEGGPAAAAALLLSLLIFVVTVFNFKFSKRWVHYED